LGCGNSLAYGAICNWFALFTSFPIRFGLLLLGVTFALISFAASLEEGKPVQNWLIGLCAADVLWGWPYGMK
jgi:hypothetical protein